MKPKLKTNMDSTTILMTLIGWLVSWSVFLVVGAGSNVPMKRQLTGGGLELPIC